MRLALLPLALAALAASCGGKEPAVAGPAAAPARGGGGGGGNGPKSRPPGFEEVGEAAGIRFRVAFLPGEQGENFKVNLYDHGSGVSVADFDGDGKDDLYFVNQLGANGLFRNNGDGTFSDATAAAGVALGDRIGTSASFADIDNDGDQDLFVASTRGGNVQFRNDGRGKFEDVTAASGLGLVAHTQGATHFDYDGDGDLDLFLTNTAKWTLEERDPEGRYHVGPSSLLALVGSAPERNCLYRNNGDGTFTDVAAEAGVSGHGWGGDMAVFDYDTDGDPDLFVTNMFGVNSLYRNEGGKRFVDVTAEVLGRTSWGAVGCRVLDVDGDGLLDLYVVDMHSDMWMNVNLAPGRIDPQAKYLGPEGPMVDWGEMSPETRDEGRRLVFLDSQEKLDRVVFGNTLFRNLGNGKFEEISRRANAETFWPWGVAAADYDRDGLEDAFLPSGMGYPYFPWRNVLLMNGPAGVFTSRSAQEGIDPRPGGPFLPDPLGGKPAARSSRAAAVLDYNADGAPDIVVNNFNERPYLYRNRFPTRHWVALRLRGTAGNRDAVGAVARVESGGRMQVRQVCGAGGYLAQSTRTLYFGLGESDRIDRCVVTWPGGAKQEVRDLKADRLTEVVEAAK